MAASERLYGIAALLAIELVAANPGDDRRELRRQFDCLVDREMIAAAHNLEQAAPFLRSFLQDLGLSVPPEQFSMLAPDGGQQ